MKAAELFCIACECKAFCTDDETNNIFSNVLYRFSLGK